MEFTPGPWKVTGGGFEVHSLAVPHKSGDPTAFAQVADCFETRAYANGAKTDMKTLLATAAAILFWFAVTFAGELAGLIKIYV